MGERNKQEMDANERRCLAVYRSLGNPVDRLGSLDIAAIAWVIGEELNLP